MKCPIHIKMYISLLYVYERLMQDRPMVLMARPSLWAQHPVLSYLEFLFMFKIVFKLDVIILAVKSV